MSRKLSRSVNPGKKLHLSDNRPLPERVDELIPLIYHPFGEKIETFSLTELERNLPITQNVTNQTNPQSANDLIQQDSYYSHNDTDDGSNVWDEYWFPCESDSSDLSQSAASFMSWSDEVEVETTKKLQQFYDALESFLYDEAPPPGNVKPELLDECLIWKTKFPHIRVVGKAIVPPSEFYVDGCGASTEKVLAIDQSDSDDETIQGSPRLSFLELDDEAEKFVYDDVTMGMRCEADSSALRGRIGERIDDDLLAFVVDKIGGNKERPWNEGRQLSSGGRQLSSGGRQLSSEGRQLSSGGRQLSSEGRQLSSEGRQLSSGGRQLSSGGRQLSSGGRQLTSGGSLEPPSTKRQPSNWERRSSPGSCFSKEQDFICERSLNGECISSQRSTTATSTTASYQTMPCVANSTLSSRLILRAPVSVVFEPVESRAYHSAAIRVQNKMAPARRLHSFAGRGVKPVAFASRQDEILRELRESQLRLSGTGSRTGNGTGDGVVREKPRSKTWSGGRHNVLPPLDSRANKEKFKSSPTALSPVSIEVNGTGLSRSEPKEASLKKYSLLGSTSTKVTSEDRNVGRL